MRNFARGVLAFLVLEVIALWIVGTILQVFGTQ